MIELEINLNKTRRSQINVLTQKVLQAFRSLYFGGFSGLRLHMYSAIESISLFLKKELKNSINIRVPSPSSFVLLATIFFFFFLMSHYEINYWNLLDINKVQEFFSHGVVFGSQQSSITTNSHIIDAGNLIAIIGGLAALVLAQVVFIAESIRDDGDYEKRRALLHASLIWPLFTITTFTFLNFFWIQIRVLALVLPFFVAVGVIYSFGKTLLNLVQPQTLKETRENYLQRKLRSVMGESVRNRIGNNILLSKLGLEKDIKIEYTLSKSWLDGGAENYIFIESRSKGWISDIHMGELANLASTLADVAKTLGFSIESTQKRNLDMRMSRTPSESTSEKIPQKTVFLLKRFAEEIPETSLFTRDS
ncbi:hypothetical protein IT397_02930, partial [Candidatus Nomurabacteria bacterium]|nr:hypothetical protein [Candidatus Nomurabacteria bacterium]